MVSALQRKNEVFEAMQHHAPSDDLSLFTHHFLTSLSERDLEQSRFDDLVGAIRHAYQVFKHTHKPQVELFNPSYEELGWHSDYTICLVHHADIPFVVDTLRIELQRLDIEVHTQANMVLHAIRDANGELQQVSDDDHTASRESLIWFEIDKITDAERLRLIKSGLQSVLKDLRQVVDDFQALKQRCTTIANQLRAVSVADIDFDEAAAFADWLNADHFTFLGYEYFEVDRQNTLVRDETCALGLARQERMTMGGRANALRCQYAAQIDDVIVFAKAPERTRIHRATYPDVVSILDLDEAGKVVGEHRLIGLYTARVYLNPASDIPLIRSKLNVVQHQSGFPATTHNAKVLQQILQVYPRDELFQSSTQHLCETAVEIVKLHERKRLRFFMNHDRFGFFCSVLLYIPRDLYTTESRIQIQALLLEALDALDANFSTYFSESIFARVQLIFRLKEGAATPDVRTLEEQVSMTVSRWEDLFRQTLESELGEEAANQLDARYRNAFPAGYRETFSPRRAVVDIQRADALKHSDQVTVSLYQNIEADGPSFRLKLFSLGEPIPLSDSLPLIEHLGAWVLAESPYVIDAKDRTIWIHDYQLELPGSLDLGEIREAFQDAFLAAWGGHTESDQFCQLVVLAGLNWRDVALLRALTRYLKQIGFELSQSWMAATLAQYSEIARDLVSLFHARFDPKRKRSTELEAKVVERITQALDQVEGLNQDRLFRRLIETIRATVRTNFFQLTDSEYKAYFSFKLKPERISDVPKPIPAFEIFVYSPQVEGVHLRSGMVARGGLRWSDRAEDYRTEVLGLVKAQQVKNSVIVPVGAKGGFYPKRLPVDQGRDAIQSEAIQCYRIFISGLLDVTDNLVAGDIVHPEQTQIHDTPDPYLVVAADKGTATFSDIANEISESRGFWLGDAFASGGSVGYDHKKMGITARGAWVSVQRHFREMGHDVQSEPFRCVGIGDMSGDVFGNGMLLSEATCLVAAFNHLHIFLDPDPDPKHTFAERARLFEMPRSSWMDYNAELISKGGGIFERAAKQISLSQEMARVLDCPAGDYTPNALLMLILKAPVDLLWNGGIGTYVKATTETHLEVGDKANDAIRVNGCEVRARVIGEGGNLGLTQRGRVEAALHGVRVNTDFIDNAGGVDCSDREVNIKIFLNQMITDGDLTRKQRDQVLASMTDEVSECVLHNNARQAQAVSLSVLHAEESPDDVLRFMQTLGARGALDRELEFLPTDELYHERVHQRQFMTRPELSVLISYAKNELKSAFAIPAVAADATLRDKALTAFPASLIQQQQSRLVNHQLVTEIAATQWANELVNLMGISFAWRMQDASGRPLVDVLKAYAVASAIYQFEATWAAIEQASALDSETQLMQMRHLHRLVRRATRWLLRNRPLEGSVADETARYQGAMDELLHKGPQWLPEAHAAEIQASAEHLVSQGVETAAATRIHVGRAFNQLIAIAEVAQVSRRKLKEVTALFVEVGERLQLTTFAKLVNQISVSNNWEALAREAFRDDLNATQQRIASVLAAKKGRPDDLVTHLLTQHETDCARWMTTIDQLGATLDVSYPMLSVALRELKTIEARVTE
jgi:glutamate dehydrogenase